MKMCAVTRGNAEHHINDRPRNAPVRTGTGVTGVVFYGVLWDVGGNDVIADHLHVPLYTVTWIARVLVVIGPLVAFFVTRRICLGLQRRDAHALDHGVETGIIRQLPDGGFAEELRPVSDEERAVLAAGHKVQVLPAADASGIPAPDRAGALGKLRALASAAFTEPAHAAETNGHAAGESNDRIDGQVEQARSVSPAGQTQTPVDPDRSA